MLSSSAKTNICSILEALVNGGGVRPEDQTATQSALAALKAELVADEATLADHETRISALEDLANGVDSALKPKADPAPEQTDPAPQAEAAQADPAPEAQATETDPAPEAQTAQTETQAAGVL